MDRVDNLSDLAPNLSGYRYAFNNPVNVTDPDGNFEYTDGYGTYSSYGASGAIGFNGVYQGENGDRGKENSFQTFKENEGGCPNPPCDDKGNHIEIKTKNTYTYPHNDGIEPDYTIEAIAIPLTKPIEWGLAALKLAIFGAKVTVKTGMTDLQLVTRAAQKAETAIGGTGRFAGTAKHTYANNLLSRYQSIYGSRGLEFNQYFNNNAFYGPGNRGFLDVINKQTMTIYDYKFGSAVMSKTQYLKYSNNFPGYSIQIIRP